MLLTSPSRIKRINPLFLLFPHISVDYNNGSLTARRFFTTSHFDNISLVSASPLGHPAIDSKYPVSSLLRIRRDFNSRHQSNPDEVKVILPGHRHLSLPGTFESALYGDKLSEKSWITFFPWFQWNTYKVSIGVNGFLKKQETSRLYYSFPPQADDPDSAIEKGMGDQ